MDYIRLLENQAILRLPIKTIRQLTTILINQPTVYSLKTIIKETLKHEKLES
jgi:hypothetical protein